MDCVFCKIVKGDIPSTKIYEDQELIAILDIMPANKGHCLIIPKTHYDTLLEIPINESCDLLNVAKKVARAISLALGAEGFNILMNNNKAAGQLVPHAHMHVIPRFKGDGIKLNWRTRKYKEKEMEDASLKIKKFLE